MELDFNSIITELDYLRRSENFDLNQKFFMKFKRSSYDLIIFDVTKIDQKDRKEERDLQKEILLFYLEIARILLMNYGKLKLVLYTNIYVTSTSVENLVALENKKNSLVYENFKDLDLFFLCDKKRFHTDISFSSSEEIIGNRMLLTFKPLFHLKPEQKTRFKID